MPTALTIDRPDIVALIEIAANRLTGGDRAELVALAIRNLMTREERSGTLYGRQAGSVRVADGVDLVAASGFDEQTDAETGRELGH